MSRSDSTTSRLAGHRQTFRRLRRKLLASVAVLATAAALLAVLSTFSAFSGTTANSGNSAAAGTVTLTDNDSGAAMFSMSSLKPGDTDTRCLQVTYTGSLPSLVRLYGTTAGTGLDAYLDLTITRGTISSGSFSDCTNFSADATNYLGQGAGVVYNGTLAAFADDWTAGVADPRTASVPEAWTTGEVHAYKLQLTQQDNNAAQGKAMTQTFTWEARNTTLYSQVVLSDQPASYWKLDEAAGTTATDSAGAVTGTYSGPVLNQATGVKDAGTAVSFDDAAVQFVNFGNNYSFAATASFSAEAWVRPTAGTAQTRRIFSKEDQSPHAGWDLQLEPTTNAPANRVTVGRWDASGGSDMATSTTALAVGRWYHVVATYDGAQLKLYVDGSLEATTASTRSVGATTNAIRLARLSYGGANYGGLLDEAAIYTTALSQQQVTEHYNAGHK
jgi:hypothetical protein